MSISLSNMRLGIVKPLGLNVGGTEITNPELDLYLNRAFWEIQNKFPLREKEFISTFETIAGGRNYDVSFPTEAVKHIAIQRPDDGQHIPLIQITDDVYEQKYKSNSDQWDIPCEYVREGCIIRLFPTPDDIYTIVIRRLVALSDLGNVNVTSGIPQVWDEIIMLGGLWRACIDFSDNAKASFYRTMQAELINTIIPTEVNEAQSNSQLAHVEVLGLEY